MPLVRAVIGTLLLLIAVPLLLAGVGLCLIDTHRGTNGAYTATIEPIHVDGYAAVVPDLDGLLRHDAPFARGGRTTLRVSVTDPGGPLVVGLARRADVDAYLADVAHTRITRAGLTRGLLPVQTVPVPGESSPAVPPTVAPLWTAHTRGLFRDQRPESPLTWSPSALRDAGLSLLVMRADGSAGLNLTVRAGLSPAWLTPTSRGLVTFGGCLLLLAVGMLIWPHRSGAGRANAQPAGVGSGGGTPSGPPDPVADAGQPEPSVPPECRPATAEPASTASTASVNA